MAALSSNVGYGDFKMRIKATLNLFVRDYNQTELVLDPMPKELRKMTHRLALKMGLKSVSKGKGDTRHTTISKRPFSNSLLSAVTASETDPLRLSRNQSDRLAKFLMQNSITENEKALVTGRAVARQTNRRMNRVPMAEMFVPPGPKPSPHMWDFRNTLPVAKFRQQILSTIQRHQVTLISGGTGCGKTTQVPQYLLEEATQNGLVCRIVCTQPRRLPAMSVAERVAKERGERIGSTVGYHIRLEQRTTEETVLTYCTSGVLMRMLSADDIARDISHVILDEVHEREQNTDYLLIALRQALVKRPDLKVILMSATMDADRELFLSYFPDVSHIHVPSNLFHVQTLHLAEVLALSGYTPPQSVFGGTFHFGPSPSVSQYQSFPRVDEFRPVHQPTTVQQRSHWPQTPLPPPPPAPINQSEESWDKVAYPPSFGPPYGPQSGGDAFHSTAAASAIPPYQRAQSFPTTSGWDQDLDSNTLDSTTLDSMTLDMVLAATARQIATASVLNDLDGAQLPNATWQSTTWRGNELLDPTDDTGSGCAAEGDDASEDDGPDVVELINSDDDDGGAAGTTARSAPTTTTETAHSHKVDFFIEPTAPDRSGDYYSAPAPSGVSAAAPFRTDFFDPSIAEALNLSTLDVDGLIHSYLSSGGQQWTDAVDPDLTRAVVRFLMDSPLDGAILVFLPGYEDIVALRDAVLADGESARIKPLVFTLHSQMQNIDQQKVFEAAPAGSRKVILSTNIAEASLTIDDVVFVIDCGKVKEKTYDYRTRVSQLQTTWIAKSNAEQRKGRAGRCRPGFCFRLYSIEEFESMLPAQVAEMKRSAIHDVCLHAKMFAPDRMNVKEFLKLAPEPPSEQAIAGSLELLQTLGALTPQNAWDDSGQELTDLGRIVAQLPVDPQLARLLLFGVTLKCFNPIVTLVAALSHRDPFILPTGEERSQALAVRDEFGKNDMSDHLMLLRAFDAYSAAGQKQWQFCRKKFLSPNTMKMIVGIRRQLLSELRRLRIVTSLSAFKDASLNRYSNCWPVVQAAIVAGCYPGIGMVKPGSRLRKIRTQTETNAMLHPGCVIKRQLMAPSRRAASALPPGQDPSMAMTDAEMANANLAEPSVAFVAYQELAKLEDCLTLRTVTAIPSVTVLLFAGSTKLDDKLVDTFDVYENSSDYGGNSDDEADEEEEEHRVVEIDSWLAFKGKFLDLQLLLKLRVKILAHFLRIMQQPSRNETPEDSALLALLAELLVSEHRKMGLAPVDDLPSLDYPQYCQPQYYNAAEHPASGYGGQSSAGPSWRSRGGRPGMNHSASWSTGGSGHSSSSSYSPGSFRPMRPYSSRGRGYSTTTFRRGSRGGGGGGGGQNNY